MSLVEPALQGKASSAITAMAPRRRAVHGRPFINLNSPILAFFPSMAIDDAGNIYLVWTNETAPVTRRLHRSGTPQTNGVYFAVSKDSGQRGPSPPS